MTIAGVEERRTTSEGDSADGAYRRNHFATGSIYWRKSNGVLTETNGAIDARYALTGFDAGYLGAPITSESPASLAGWRCNHFVAGAVYWDGTKDANAGKTFEVNGAIDTKYASLGYEASVLGVPLADESNGATAGGRYNHFMWGSIYWRGDLGPHEVHGLIHAGYQTIGYDGSCLGLPTSDEVDSAPGAVSTFEHGTIRWTRGASSVTVFCDGRAPQIIVVH